MKTLIKNANAYINGSWVDTDVLIEGNLIVEIDKNISETADEVIDASGKKLLPGFVDLHCH